MIKVLFEDKDVIVVIKPANMTCQRDFSRSPDLEGELGKRMGSKPFLIHRLDRHVEGPLVLAKTKAGAKGLNAQLNKGGFTKVYEAVIVNADKKELMRDQKFPLCHYMRKEKSLSHVIDEKTYAALKGDKNKAYKKAVMDVTCVNERQVYEQKLALLRIQLETGRFHQIRSQLSFIGLPILGDPKYGIKSIGDTEYKGIGLQCVRLGFQHPITGKHLVFDARHKNDGFSLFL